MGLKSDLPHLFLRGRFTDFDNAWLYGRSWRDREDTGVAVSRGGRIVEIEASKVVVDHAVLLCCCRCSKMDRKRSRKVFFRNVYKSEVLCERQECVGDIITPKRK